MLSALSELPPEIIAQIVPDEKWWWQIAKYSKEFREYTYKSGRTRYISLATSIVNTTRKTYYELFGKFHREDGPAMIKRFGSTSETWYYAGLVHRLDGPARICYEDGKIKSEYWYQHDQRHRIDGPATIIHDKTYEYYRLGQLHREDGPARFNRNGIPQYYLHGNKVGYLNAFSPLPLELKIHIASFDKTTWYLLTRHDAAFRNYAFSTGRSKFIELFTKVIKSTADMMVKTEIKLLGRRHCETGPALIIESPIERKEFYFIAGKKHRENAPAYTTYNQYNVLRCEKWFHYGKKQSPTINGELMPAVIRYHSISSSYIRIWYQDGKIGRPEDLPTVIKDDHVSITYAYHRNGLLHRDNGPAVITEYPERDAVETTWYKNGEPEVDDEFSF